MALPDVGQLQELWSPLAELNGNPFLSWEWASTWWDHFGDGREQRILGVEDSGGELVGIAPLHLHSRQPVRTLRQIGHFPADQLGIVCAPEREGEIGRAVCRHLEQADEWDLLIAERLSSGTAVEPLEPRLIRTEAMPELRIETDDWDRFLGSKSSNFRGQVRNRERRLRRDHGLEFRLCDDPARLADDMETLFSLHRETRRARGEDGDGAFPRALAAFHLDFATAALEQGWLRFWLAYLGGEPAAAWYGFRLNQADWYYQGGRDPARERESVGFVLMAHTVRDAVANGIHTYKLLLGGEEYKQRFSSHTPAVETFVATGGVRGRLALGAKLAGDRALGRLAGLRRRG